MHLNQLSRIMVDAAAFKASSKNLIILEDD